MQNKLRKFRVLKEYTQKKLAAEIGISQSTYQRYEAGSLDIPDEKLSMLAKVLATSEQLLMGTHAPIKAAFYAPDSPEELQYYGEVVFHFIGGSPPLLLSISEEERKRLEMNLSEGAYFLDVESLSNQKVAVRRSAILDVYFSSEAYDDYGPEHGNYEIPVVRIPDPRDWEVIEAIFNDEDIDDYDPDVVMRIKEILTITDDESEVSEEIMDARNTIFDLASTITVRFSNGVERKFGEYDEQAIFYAFNDVFNPGEADEDTMIQFSPHGYHRFMFFNRSAVDYISVPTHWWENARIRAMEIEELGE